jgi:hypothetical protein
LRIELASASETEAVQAVLDNHTSPPVETLAVRVLIIEAAKTKDY